MISAGCTSSLFRADVLIALRGGPGPILAFTGTGLNTDLVALFN